MCTQAENIAIEEGERVGSQYVNCFFRDLLRNEIPSGFDTASGFTTEDETDVVNRDKEPSTTMTQILYDEVLKRYDLLYCHFCTDPIHPGRMHICTTCGALICEALVLGGIGCIRAMSIIPSLPFRCHICVRKSKTPAIVPYELAASGIQYRAKLTWPLLLVTIKLVNLTSPPLDVTVMGCRAEYENAPGDVSFVLYFDTVPPS